MSSTDCSGVNSILAQRRQIALYNVPLNRLTLTSPYPQFTKLQLDMRRKIEILKYDNTSSSTKTNNLTKKQNWSQLVKGSTQNYSQNAIIASPNISTCPLDAFIPTLTSSCDVPGPVMILQYDPSVPLYNYITNNRTYPDQNLVNDVIYSQYTTNFITFLEKNAINLPADISTMQNRSSPIGVIYTGTSIHNLFSISTPLALWVNFVYGLGLFDSNGNMIQQPGKISDIDEISMNITNISLTVSYNGIPIVLSSNPVLSSTSGLNDLFFTGKNVTVGQYYGIQYIGMLNITNLQLPSASNAIYDINITISYNVYINGSLFSSKNPFDFFQTGIFTNVTSDNINFTTPGFLFSSIVPPYQAGTFTQFSNALASSSNIIG